MQADDLGRMRNVALCDPLHFGPSQTKHVISTRPWGTHVVQVSDGTAYHTTTYPPAGNIFRVQPIMRSGNKYKVCSPTHFPLNATTRPPFYCRSICGKFDGHWYKCSLGLGHELLGIPTCNDDEFVMTTGSCDDSVMILEAWWLC